jgi:hypothetical protein
MMAWGVGGEARIGHHLALGQQHDALDALLVPQVHEARVADLLAAHRRQDVAVVDLRARQVSTE